MRKFTVSLTLLGLLILPAGAFATAGPQDTTLATQVRHELLMLPYYGVFDNLNFQIDGSTVTLSGEAVRPTLRHDAEAAVSRLADVSQVVNEIEVLPLSRYDNWLRLGVLRAIYRQDSLQKYGFGAHPSIHVIVKNGHVRLEGEVGREMDSQLAYFGARGVSGSFTVTNNLRVAN